MLDANGRIISVNGVTATGDLDKKKVAPAFAAKQLYVPGDCGDIYIRRKTLHPDTRYANRYFGIGAGSALPRKRQPHSTRRVSGRVQ